MRTWTVNFFQGRQFNEFDKIWVSVFEQFPAAGQVGGDDAASRSECLEQDQRQPLIEGRQDEQMAPPHEPGKLLLGQPTMNRHQRTSLLSQLETLPLLFPGARTRKMEMNIVAIQRPNCPQQNVDPFGQTEFTGIEQLHRRG